MTQLQDAIRQVLAQTSYNIQATAARLGVSEEYVRRVAADTGQKAPPPSTATPLPSTEGDDLEKKGGLVPREAETAPPPLGGARPPPPSVAVERQDQTRRVLQEFLAALLPQNRDGIVQLRDTIIDGLQVHIDEASLPARYMISLLRLILEYENQIRAIARPALNLSVDNSQHATYIDMTALVDKLEGADPKLLSKLAGPRVIDGEVRRVGRLKT